MHGNQNCAFFAENYNPYERSNIFTSTKQRILWWLDIKISACIIL
jgi:hypothetical protein